MRLVTKSKPSLLLLISVGRGRLVYSRAVSCQLPTAQLPPTVNLLFRPTHLYCSYDAAPRGPGVSLPTSLPPSLPEEFLPLNVPVIQLFSFNPNFIRLYYLLFFLGGSKPLQPMSKDFLMFSLDLPLFRFFPSFVFDLWYDGVHLLWTSCHPHTSSVIWCS